MDGRTNRQCILWTKNGDIVKERVRRENEKCEYEKCEYKCMM